MRNNHSRIFSFAFLRVKILVWVRQDQANLFHRSVIARRRSYNLYSFKKATEKLQKALRLSSQANTLLSDRQCTSVSWMVFITLS